MKHNSFPIIFRPKPFMMVFIAMMLMMALINTYAQAQNNIPQSRQQISLSFSPIVDAVAPSIVNIYAKRVVERRTNLFNEPFFQRFFGDNFNFGLKQQRVENSLGSGVIVDAMGLIITNHHVIENAEEIRIVLRDKREYDASIIISDRKTDLAILRLSKPPKSLPVAPFGDPDQLAVGDLVLAIGNPFGVGQTVTSGIISGLARSGVGISDIQSFIQTDAAINPGNSGGALVDLQGRVIGINTAIFSRSGGSHGIGFAIPANLAQLMVKQAKSGEGLVRPWLGIRASSVDFDMAEALSMALPQGVLVEQIYDESPALKAGLNEGDIILTADDKPIDELEELRFRALLLGIGEKIPLTVLRQGRQIDLSMALIEAPEIPKRDDIKVKGSSPLSGALLANLSPKLALELNLPDDKKGVVIAGLLARSPATRYRFEIGDIIREYNGQKISSTSMMRQLLEETKNEATWLLTIERNGKLTRVEFR